MYSLSSALLAVLIPLNDMHICHGHDKSYGQPQFVLHVPADHQHRVLHDMLQ